MAIANQSVVVLLAPDRNFSFASSEPSGATPYEAFAALMAFVVRSIISLISYVVVAIVLPLVLTLVIVLSFVLVVVLAFVIILVLEIIDTASTVTAIFLIFCFNNCFLIFPPSPSSPRTDWQAIKNTLWQAKGYTYIHNYIRKTFIEFLCVDYSVSLPKPT